MGSAALRSLRSPLEDDDPTDRMLFDPNAPVPTPPLMSFRATADRLARSEPTEATDSLHDSDGDGDGEAVGDSLTSPTWRHASPSSEDDDDTAVQMDEVGDFNPRGLGSERGSETGDPTGIHVVNHNEMNANQQGNTALPASVTPASPVALSQAMAQMGSAIAALGRGG